MDETVPSLTLSSRAILKPIHPEEFQQLELCEWRVNGPALNEKYIPGT
jgi:hypothetical protein